MARVDIIYSLCLLKARSQAFCDFLEPWLEATKEILHAISAYFLYKNSDAKVPPFDRCGTSNATPWRSKKINNWKWLERYS